VPNRSAALSSLLAACLSVALPAAASPTERTSGYETPTQQYSAYCPGDIGLDYPWPAYSDSPAVNQFRDQIVFALKSLYGFEYDQETFPEVTVPIGNPSRPITLPQGWIIAMDAVPGVYTVAVAIPPKDGPFADREGLTAVLAKKNQIFGPGGHVVDVNPGVRLPCTPGDAGNRAPAIVIDVPYKGSYEM